MATGWFAWTCLLLATGAPGAADDVVHMNQRGFQIPFSIQPARQAEVKELILWRSADQGRTWGIAARATPDKKGFEVFEREDGLLYFTIAVVDHKGVMDPPDVYRAAIGQKIHMDAVKPAVRVVSAERVGDEVQVGWEAREDRPEWTSFRLEYQAGGGPWTPLPVQPAERGNHRFRPGGAGDVSVRVVLRDLAGNEGTDERLVPGSGVGHHDRAVVGAAGVAPPRPIDTGSTPPPPPPPPPASTSVPPPPPAGGATAPATGAITAPAGRGSLPALQIVNKRLVKLGFDVSRVGPSGVGPVEVYVTTDEGANWVRSDADPGVSLPVTADAREGGPMKGTVSVNVPRDGQVYGFYLVVKSRAGLGKPAPRPGDVPHVRIEVDTTEPEAVLRAPQPDPARSDSLILVWEATDRNLASNPITLEWSSGPNGPWEFIGESALPNSGRYSWQITSKLPPKVYLKLTVRDTAGNTAVAQTREAVLIDLSRPEVGNVGVVVGR